MEDHSSKLPEEKVAGDDRGAVEVYTTVEALVYIEIALACCVARAIKIVV
jgi:hypothetical protein